MSIDILAIFAHPDDEFFVCGMLAKLVGEGKQIVLVSTTRGEAGEISDPELATTDNLGEVREQELISAAAALGIQDVRFLGYRDSGMESTPQNDDPRALYQAEPAEVVGRVVRMIRELQPRIIITFEPYGIYGHPDHIATSKYVTAAFRAAADEAAYPEAGNPWQAEMLFHSGVPYKKFRELRANMEAVGGDTSDLAVFDSMEAHAIDDKITHRFDISAFQDVKFETIQFHRTQFGPENIMLKMSEDMRNALLGEEYLIQVEPSVPNGTPIQTKINL